MRRNVHQTTDGKQPNHTALKRIRNQTATETKSLRIVGWRWDDFTLNEVRVENLIYQKEISLLQGVHVYSHLSETLDNAEEEDIHLYS